MTSPPPYLLLLLGLALTGCPHDFSRQRPADGGPDAATRDANPEAAVADAAPPDTIASVDGVCLGDASLCGGLCVNVLTSAQHCGACGNACAAGQDCVNGSCTCVAGGNCTGCCDGDTCRAPGSGQSVSSCGVGGESCESCDDQLTCSTDACDATGSCTHSTVSGYCLIDGACHADGAYKNGPSGCLQCQSAKSSGRWTGLPNKGCVYTLAGDGTAGYQDGAPYQARFDEPAGVAIDGSGNVLVADQGNDRIRKIENGDVKTYAGSGTYYSPPKDGALLAASFHGPTGLAWDSAGTLYVTDRIQNRVRTISGGNVNTVAGYGTVDGYQDGPALSAMFSWPSGLAVGSGGTVYVADQKNHLIRTLVVGGDVKTLAGVPSASGNYKDGPVAAAEFSFPLDVIVRPPDEILVADSGTSCIRMIKNGVVSTLAGKGNTPGYKNGSADTALFDGPGGLALLPGGDVLVADGFNHRIRMIAGGQVTTVAGSGTQGFEDGPLLSASFNKPRGVAVDASGKIYVADMNNHSIRVIVP